MTADDIERFKLDFAKLDTKNTGVLTIEDLRAEGRVVQPKRKSLFYKKQTVVSNVVVEAAQHIRSASFDIASSVGTSFTNLIKSPQRSPRGSNKSGHKNMYDDPEKSVNEDLHEDEQGGGEGGTAGAAAAAAAASAAIGERDVEVLISIDESPNGCSAVELTTVRVTEKETLTDARKRSIVIEGGLEC